MKRKRTGYDNILKMLKKHLPSCTMNRYSDRENRKCSCGKDAAKEELNRLLGKISVLEDELKNFEEDSWA